MKKIIVYILFVTFSVVNCQLSIAQNQVPGTKVTSAIVPNDLRDDMATHVDSLGAGGYRSVETIAQRNAIKPSRLLKNMLVFVAADSTYYQYTPKGWKTAKLGGDTSQFGTYIITVGGAVDNPQYPVVESGKPIKYTAPFASITYSLNIVCYNRFGPVPFLITSKLAASFSLQVVETCTCVFDAKQ